jgi:hypothetical protein
LGPGHAPLDLPRSQSESLDESRRVPLETARRARTVLRKRGFTARTTPVDARRNQPGRDYRFADFLGKNIEFGSGADEIAFPAGCGEWPLTNADSRLNKILLKVCEDGHLIRFRNGWLTEGFDTRDLKDAKALLAELAA